MNTKEAAIAIIQSMPEGVTWADIIARFTAREDIPEVPGEPVSEEQAEAAWAEVINRRVEELESGKVQAIPAEEVHRRDRGKKP